MAVLRVDDFFTECLGFFEPLPGECASLGCVPVELLVFVGATFSDPGGVSSTIVPSVFCLTVLPLG